jgi:hypothetical protein
MVVAALFFRLSVIFFLAAVLSWHSENRAKHA